jgi:YggT family protein
VILALDLYKLVIIAAAVMSWLIAFNVVNIRNDVVRTVWATVVALTEPALRPIRRFLPNTGGIDISPVVLFLLILLIEQIIALYVYPYVF